MVRLQKYTTAELNDVRQTLLDVHAEVYADSMAEPIVQRFPWFVEHWGSNPQFSCVVAYELDQAVGFAYGAHSKEGREWWREYWSPAAEEESSTFSLSELMIRPAWRKQGISLALHDALIADRPEALSVLFVDIAHPRVQALYETWGYKKVGERQPRPDAPLMAVMLKHLRTRDEPAS